MNESLLAELLYSLTEELDKKTPERHAGGGLGGEHGYGQAFENDVFMMHPYCWCEKEDCLWCGGDASPFSVHAPYFEGPQNEEGGMAPNFHYKPLNFKVWWYKYIGRGMEINKTLSNKELLTIFQNCIDSVKK